MGCVAQSITNLCDLDGWIKGALVTLPICHSDNIPDLGRFVEAFLLFRDSLSSLLHSFRSKACRVTGGFLVFCAWRVINRSTFFMAVHK